jgi:hypothetical protein
LSENILEILVICIDIAGVTKKIMLSNLQGMNNSGKFKVMGRIILLMAPQLVRDRQ